jgi:hypothetical protein
LPSRRDSEAGFNQIKEEVNIMEALRIEQIFEKDGEIEVTGLPFKKGQYIEIILIPKPTKKKRPRLTVGQFRQSGLIGIWKDRDDIQNSSLYARQLRDQAQQRRQYDFAG